MDLISTSSVGAIHGVLRQSVVRWIDAGLLPARRGVGRVWLVDRHVAAAFIPPVRGGRAPKFMDCEVPGCDRPHHALHKCKPHYQRWTRMGSVNAGKPISRVPLGQYNRRAVKQVPRRIDLIDTDEL